MDPVEVFFKLLRSSFLSPRGPKPGDQMKALTTADREVLKELKSEDLQKLRTDAI
jgi:hypothetical protein